MKNILALILIGVFLSFPSLSYCRGLMGNVNFFLGKKQSDDDGLKELDLKTAGEFGLMMDFKDRYWPVSLEIDLFMSSAEDIPDDVRATRSTDEVGFGFRKYFVGRKTLGPFIGAGVAYIHGVVKEEDRANNKTYRASGSTLGPWVNLGFQFKGSSGINFGLIIRQSYGEVELQGDNEKIKTQAGGKHVGIFIGLSFD